MKNILMPHRQPQPTIRAHSFNKGVQKGQWNHSIIYKSLLKHAATSQKSLKPSFLTKKKKGGILMICLSSFVGEKVNRVHAV
jgi:hypothetical protein